MKQLLTSVLLAAAMVMPAAAQTWSGDSGASWPSSREGDMSRPGAQDWTVMPDVRHYGISDGRVLSGGDTHLRTTRYIADFSLREAELGGPG
ncbi:MAG TPA: hypothetical protein VGP01_05925 [Rhizomicrobium sp.]|jgi:hypothetical protein|nr:hypothetical protein [Rhizomicrobium sp.]